MNDEDVVDQLSAFDEIGDEFNQDVDSLKKYDQQFKQIDQDPVEIYCEVVVSQMNNTDKANRRKISRIEEYLEHMEQYERHPACANSHHISQFINKEIRKGHQPHTINLKISEIESMFDYWSNHPKMPHPPEGENKYNPATIARGFKKDAIQRNSKSIQKTPPRIPIEELSHRIRQIKNTLHRAFIVCQLKHGSRAGQTSNLQLRDIQLNHDGLNKLYPELGTHPRLRDVKEDAIYYAPFQEREGGKSKRPIVLPIDNELNRLLVKYLRLRPPVEEPWLFLNPATCGKITTGYANERFWKNHFQPEYAETELYRGVTSHFARHYFSTYWKTQIDTNEEYLKYMRGDKNGDLDGGSPDIMYTYIHTHFPDVKDEYLRNIYKFGI
ncbi:site-specific integrase [Natronolimnobius sp. AArcel1]|uniref:site-specific integrase n=1 Tax=Natronolimnobius sp. AArcel1 TaxID=1679093 RepID=UPI0013E9E576|nr:site-specific integrase [Natronolimnobius sp. AArcel1]NGM70264.1 site-specific integrase [Natronolimnobius sp. AArcel1]